MLREQIVMTDKHQHHGDRDDHNKRSLDRIRRVKGQLEALERLIEADEGTCEQRVIMARTVEKGMTSLITHLVECYIDNTASVQTLEDPTAAVIELKRIINLVNSTTPYKNPGKSKKTTKKRKPSPIVEG
jgi:DNA-binding FrmR family transcriptional regulator